MRGNAYPPRTHFRAGDGGELIRVPFHVVSGIPAAMSQYTNGWCTYTCEGWHQYRYSVPITLYDLVVPVQSNCIGDVEHFGEGRISMLWLVDGRVHLISDYWQPKAGEKNFRFLGSHEPVRPVPARDWTKQLCLGYS